MQEDASDPPEPDMSSASTQDEAPFSPSGFWDQFTEDEAGP